MDTALASHANADCLEIYYEVHGARGLHTSLGKESVIRTRSSSDGATPQRA